MTSWTRLVRFVAKETGKIHIGQPVDETIDVGLVKSFKAYEISGKTALDRSAKVLKDRVLTVEKLLTPLDRSEVGIVRCIGLNYSDHAAEAKMAIPDRPTLFYKPVATLIAPNEPIRIPKVAQPVQEHLPDYEVELVIVIGRSARDVPEENALDYVLGYSVGNDVSFRQHQLAVTQWGFSKSFDDTTPFGPCILSASAVPDPQRLAVKTTLNGKELQDGNTSNQIFGVKKLVAYLSQGTTLSPGTIIYTGTPKGVGAFANPKIFLKNGDDVRVWVENIGTLVNPIIEDRNVKTRAKL